jgi:AcrR family transcriptional regulator
VVVTTRRYEQKLRAATAEETRQRILDATRVRLRAAPSEPVSVEKVAQDAGVARSTVYLIFGSRAGLFEALGRNLLERAGFHRIVEAVQRPDPREALRESLRAAVEVYADEREVARALASMAQLNPEAVGSAFEVIDHGRAEGLLHLANRLRDQGELRPDLTPREAADCLWVITSFDTFDQLYTGRGLSRTAVADRLVSLAEGALCVPPRPAKRSRRVGAG